MALHLKEGQELLGRVRRGTVLFSFSSRTDARMLGWACEAST